MTTNYSAVLIAVTAFGKHRVSDAPTTVKTSLWCISNTALNTIKPNQITLT